MTADELHWVLRSFAHRAPFRPFVVEFVNGEQIVAIHPEAVGHWRGLAMYRDPDGRFQVFGASSVCRVFDYEADLDL